MDKPVIVITPQNKPMEAPFEKNYAYTNTFNMQALLSAGALPVLPDYMGQADAEALLARADGLLLSGGADIDPKLYGEEKLPQCEELCRSRDLSDLNLLRAALRLRKPILCICRGCQIANVFFGGTLYQDLAAQHPSAIRHPAWDGPEYKQAVHAVRVVPGTPLHALFPVEELQVNSLHHQAIRTLAPELKAMACAPDGIVESWYLPSEEQFIRAYQWHPEMLEDYPQRRAIFGEFLEACRAK